jgi:hypothetical protein
VTTERVCYFLREWNAAILRYEQADREFRRITAGYLAQVDATRPVRTISPRRPHEGLVDATRPVRSISARRPHEGLTVVEATELARQDVNRKHAAAAREHFADRAMLYGMSALVGMLCGDATEQLGANDPAAWGTRDKNIPADATDQVVNRARHGPQGGGVNR